MTATQLRQITYRRHLAGVGAYGLGDVTPQQITSSIGSSLMATAGIVVAFPGGQLPGAIIAAAGALTSLIGGLFKPDLTKIEATHIVDSIEAQTMQPMRASWVSLPPSQKTRSMQAHYLNVFDQAWAALVQGCSNPALAQAGVNCIGDRGPSSCHWTVTGETPGNPPDCGNWYVWYRDPIANDPDVIPDPVAQASVSDTGGSLTDSISSIFSGGGGAIALPLLVGGALIALALVLD